MILNKVELQELKGGSSISGTLINSICKLISTLLDLGRSVGSAISYKKNGNICR